MNWVLDIFLTALLGLFSFATWENRVPHESQWDDLIIGLGWILQLVLAGSLCIVGVTALLSHHPDGGFWSILGAAGLLFAVIVDRIKKRIQRLHH